MRDNYYLPEILRVKCYGVIQSPFTAIEYFQGAISVFGRTALVILIKGARKGVSLLFGNDLLTHWFGGMKSGLETCNVRT